MSTILANIGNTNAEFAEYDDGVPKNRSVCTTEALLTGALPEQLSGEIHLVAATVVPEVKTRLDRFDPTWIGPDLDVGIDFSLVDSSTLGADRIANCIAAAELFPLPVIIVDCGTAITFEVIDKQRRFIGGAILPGRKLQRKALQAGTAQLPEVELIDDPLLSPGPDTVSAIQVGIDLGLIGAIGTIIEQFRRDLDHIAVAVAVGGDRSFFADRVPGLTDGPENFTLQGIAFAAGKSG